MNYVIKKLDKKAKLVSFNYNHKGFISKTKSKNNLGVKEIVIVSPTMINSLINYTFNKKYKRILELYLNAIESDESSEGNFVIVLDEIARLRSIMIKKYRNLLKKETEEKFLKRLKLLENEIRSKYIDFKLIKEQELANNNIIEEEVASRR